MASPQIVPGRMAEAVIASAAAADSTDAAAMELAMIYAEAIDLGGDVAKLGPPLLAALEALHLTPRARASKGGTTVGGSSPLDELRARRARRDNAPALDATAT